MIRSPDTRATSGSSRKCLAGCGKICCLPRAENCPTINAVLSRVLNALFELDYHMPNAAETVEAPYTAAERLTFLPQPASVTHHKNVWPGYDGGGKNWRIRCIDDPSCSIRFRHRRICNNLRRDSGEQPLQGRDGQRKLLSYGDYQLLENLAGHHDGDFSTDIQVQDLAGRSSFGVEPGEQDVCVQKHSEAKSNHRRVAGSVSPSPRARPDVAPPQ